MSAFDQIDLQTPNDYKFFAYVIGEKLRNPNFKPEWIQNFIKTFLEEIKTVCSYRCYEKIEKMLNQIGNQKHQEEKQQQERQKKQSNKKIKNLKTAKINAKTDKYGQIIEDVPSSNSQDDDYYDD